MKAPFASLIALFFGLAGLAQGDAGYREKFTPYPEDGFPQIIQKSDYPTISFIESLYRGLVKASGGVEGPGRFGYAVDCEVSTNALTFRSTRGPVKLVVVRRTSDKEAIIHSGTRFTNRPTVVLCSRLLAVLNDLTARGPCRGARVSQFGTRGYRQRTTIEFDFGAEIAVIDCHSNGPKNEERLYILDIVQRGDSLLFHRPTDPVSPSPQ